MWFPSVIKLSKVVAPVPPSLVAKVPVILVADKSKPIFPVSITKPPSAFVSIDNWCIAVSSSIPVVAKPSPAAIVDT